MILQGVILQDVTFKTTAIWSYRLNYIQIQNVIFKICYFNRQYNDLLEESKLLDLVNWGGGSGAHIKMAEDCGQVARPCNSDVAVTIID
jgi:hypothetical protein